MPQFSDFQVQCWMEERLANCQWIAKLKSGKDRDGWLNDAEYFRAAIKLIQFARQER